MRGQISEALVVGHAGHELRLHGWLSAVKPIVFVVTDGSGATGVGRLAATEAILSDAGAAIGSVFGALSDKQAYEAILSGDVRVFLDLTETIAGELSARGVRSVTGDGWEGYNPVHDVCRLMIDAAVRIVSRQGGGAVENWSFPLHARPDMAAPCETVRRVALEDAAFERKLELAEQYRELAADVQWAFREYGREAFRFEVMTRAFVPRWEDRTFLSSTPFYESHGLERVKEGKYGSVIRYEEHIIPIAEALRNLAEAG